MSFICECEQWRLICIDMTALLLRQTLERTAVWFCLTEFLAQISSIWVIARASYFPQHMVSTSVFSLFSVQSQQLG